MVKAKPKRASSSPRDLLTPAGLHILLSLSEGERHGYGIKLEVEARTQGALTLGPGTLYEAIHRMERAGWIEQRPGDDPRRRPYRLTARGREQMRGELERLDTIVRFARSRELLPGTRS
jgi:DNA-binding PadR family transcriptional regulator